MQIRDETSRLVLEATVDHARQNNYCGYDKHDGMSNAFLQALPFENKWVNIAVQEIIKRSPVNIRPLFGVERRRNFLSIGLFSTVNFRLYELTGEERYLTDALELADWLVENTSSKYSYFCGGHPHPVQTLNRGIIPANTPDVVCTFHGVEAVALAAAYDNRYREHVVSAADFVVDELRHEADEYTKILYRPDDPGTFFTVNANAVGARLLAMVAEITGDDRHERMARDLLDYVANQQTDLGGWEYRDPPSASHLSMDNYHNGFIIESFINATTALDMDAYDDTVTSAVEFYREVLFNEAGSPNWDESTAYPKDIHATAQGISVFGMLGRDEFAARIFRWTLENLYAGDGRFYYQQNKYFSKRFTLMRWCQAWMAYALTNWLQSR